MHRRSGQSGAEVRLQQLGLRVGITLSAAIFVTGGWFWDNRRIDRMEERLMDRLATLSNEMSRGHSVPGRAESIRLPPEPFSIAGTPLKGNPKAKVAILEFADFQCPACGSFVRDTLPQILTEYVDAGRVALVFNDLPLDRVHDNAVAAAVAAECANESGHFWPFHDLLFEHQKRLDSDSLRGYARAVGVEGTRFQDCIASTEARALISRRMESADRLGISGTPTFLFGLLGSSGVRLTTQLVGAQPYALFRATLENLLADSGRMSQ